MARVNVPFYGSATRKRAMEFPEERPDPPVIWSIDRKSRCKGAALEFGKNNSAIKSRSREYTAAEAFRPALGTYRAKTWRARVEAFDRGSTPSVESGYSLGLCRIAPPRPRGWRRAGLPNLALTLPTPKGGGVPIASRRKRLVMNSSHGEKPTNVKNIQADCFPAAGPDGAETSFTVIGSTPIPDPRQPAAVSRTAARPGPVLVPSAASQVKKRSIDPLRLARSFRRRGLSATLLGTLLGTLAGVVTWFVVPPARYTATARLYVASVAPMFMYKTREAAPEYATFRQTQLALLKSQQVIDTALSQDEVKSLHAVRTKADPDGMASGPAFHRLLKRFRDPRNRHERRRPQNRCNARQRSDRGISSGGRQRRP